MQSKQCYGSGECLYFNGRSGWSRGSPSVIQGMTEQQVEGLIRCIAEIHAISLSIPNSQEVLEQLKWNCTLDQEDGQTKNSVMENLLKLPVDYFKRNKEALLKVVSQNEIMIYEVHKHFNTPAVLCHGDFWANNIIFSFQDENTKEIGSEVYALLDWQFAHPSTGLIDVLRCILIGVNASVKLRCLEGWIELYFKSSVLAAKNSA
uniref:CHK kinase-like domain-containing protein n=1 Tax=Ditylenchus dipsaci TaxID=166011 RepID=A0A915E749_9BILA